MATQSQMKATAKYLKLNYDDLKVRLPKGGKQVLLDFLENLNKEVSVDIKMNGFIVTLINGAIINGSKKFAENYKDYIEQKHQEYKIEQNKKINRLALLGETSPQADPVPSELNELIPQDESQNESSEPNEPAELEIVHADVPTQNELPNTDEKLQTDESLVETSEHLQVPKDEPVNLIAKIADKPTDMNLHQSEPVENELNVNEDLDKKNCVQKNTTNDVSLQDETSNAEFQKDKNPPGNIGVANGVPLNIEFFVKHKSKQEHIEYNRAAPNGMKLLCPICDDMFIKKRKTNYVCSKECKNEVHRRPKIGYARKLTPSMVLEIVNLIEIEKMSYRKIAKKYDVTPPTVQSAYQRYKNELERKSN